MIKLKIVNETAQYLSEHDIIFGEDKKIVPEISRFFGIIIRMYFDDHNPPHFHAIYGKTEALVGINPILNLSGDLPFRAISMVVEWSALHQQELMDNWQRLHVSQPAQKIEPLR